MGESALEITLLKEVARLHGVADELERRAAPIFVPVDARDRWQRDSWVAVMGLRDAARRIEEALSAIELARTRA
jgi:hypothetical protein